MQPLKIKYAKPHSEKAIQKKICNKLRQEGFHVMETHGNAFQDGFPDIFSCHSRYGQRWIEVKKPGMIGSRFTPAQLREFPKICANGSGVWVITGPDHDEYLKLFEPCNWWHYIK